MCIGISCEVVKNGETITVYFGDPSCIDADRDGHTAIRKFNKIGEDDGAAVLRRGGFETRPYMNETSIVRANQECRNPGLARPA